MRDEGYLDVGHLVATIGMGVIVAVGLVLLPKLWRMEADIQKREATAKWWPFSEALREGFVRSVPTAIVACLLLELGLVASFFEKLYASSLAGRISTWLGLAFIIALVVDLCVTLFNQPKFFVPPAARNEPGAIALWWSSRRHRPHRKTG